MIGVEFTIRLSEYSVGIEMHLSYRQLRNGILYFVNSKMLKAQHSEN